MIFEQAWSHLAACCLVAFPGPIQYWGQPLKICSVAPFKATPDMLDYDTYQLFDAERVQRMGHDPERCLIMTAPKGWGVDSGLRHLAVLPNHPSEPLLVRCRHVSVLPDWSRTWAAGEPATPIEEAEYEVVPPSNAHHKSTHPTR